MNRNTSYAVWAKRHGVSIVKLELPGNKYTSAMQMTCRVCGTSDQIINASTGSKALMPPEVVVKKFRQMGWEIRGAKCTCPKCLTPNQRVARISQQKGQDGRSALESHSPSQNEIAPPEPPVTQLPFPTVNLIENEEPETMAEPAVQSIEPDRATKRRIHDEIQGNWDDRVGRYMGLASDQSIADALKVPRAWVANIRADFFGDDGSNEEIGNLKKELAEKITDTEKLVENSMELAGKFDGILTELRAMRSRLERIERQTLPKR